MTANTREIKFRAWDTQNECFLESFGFVRYPDGTLGVNDSTPPFNKYGLVVLMQYTGLKDKNGVEIYEGDIVQSKSVDGPLLWQVVWGELDVLTGFDYVPIGHSFSSVHNRLDENCEVIGNIYENPELLDPTPQKGKDND